MATSTLFSPVHDIPAGVDKQLCRILSWPREYKTESEQAFMTSLQAQITQVSTTKPTVLPGGTLFVEVPGKKKRPSRVLFSCHTDTVDRTIGKPTEKHMFEPKKLTYDPNFGIIALEKEGPHSCLGADDGVGVWLMLKMIEAKVPGGYIFHRGEECGGVGANQVLKECEALLKSFDAAIAFDRPNDYEVITHQGSMECCSQEFAKALCAALNANKLSYEPSSKGIFTDTRVYRGVIAECVNIGVGYKDQHSRAETQDYAHLTALLKACLAIDWDALPIARDPKKAEVYVPRFSPMMGQFRKSGYKDYPQSSGKGYSKAPKEYFSGYVGQGKPKAKAVQPKLDTFTELSDLSLLELEDWAEDDPHGAAKAIAQLVLEIGRLRSDVKLLTQLSGVEDEIPEDDDDSYDLAHG